MATVVELTPVHAIPPFPNPLRRPFAALFWVIRTSFGILALIVLLAVIAAIPLVNFLALGYLLEVQGRVARTGKLRSAVPLWDIAPRIGSVVLGIWLWLIPLRLLGDAATDAALIDFGSRRAIVLERITQFAGVAIAFHLILALAAGGSLGCFFRPIRNFRRVAARLRTGRFLETSAAGLHAFFARMRLWHHFWLGLRGFAGAFIWLVIPTAMLAAAAATEGPRNLIAVLGGVGLVIVLAWLPFLQAHFAAQNRFKAFFELRTVRRLFKRAPVSWLAAVIFVYALSLPLYLFKIVAPPRDALWLITIIFIVSIFPVKVILGWVYYRAAFRREQNAWFGLRWGSRLLMLPLLAAYVFILFLTPAVSEHGRVVLFEHHAFLLPVPF